MDNVRRRTTFIISQDELRAGEDDPTFYPFENARRENERNAAEDSVLVEQRAVVKPLICETAAINNYQYIIGQTANDLPGTAYSPVLDEDETFTRNATSISTSFEMAGTTAVDENADIVDKFKKSFGFGRGREGDGISVGGPTSTLPSQDRFSELPIPYTESCVASNNILFDSLELSDFWLAFKSSAAIQNAVFGIRVMVFAVLPAFILVQNESTKGYFAAGLLLPTFSAALAVSNVGLQFQMTVMMFQTAFVLYLWGTFVQMTNMADHMIAWWFAMFLVCFLIYLMGDVPSKRLMMVFVIMMMESELQIKPDPSSHFPANFARDFIFAALFPLCASFIPYPVFACRLANTKMKQLHDFYAAAIGNAMKSFWAPVLIDAEIARNQIPLGKIRDTTNQIRGLMKAISYEPREFGLRNTFRNERLDHLTRVRWCIYSLAASSSLHCDLKQISLLIPMSDDLKQSQKRMQDLAFRLSAEIMRVVTELGTALTPEEIKKTDFGPLADLGTAMEDLIRSERENTLLAKTFTVAETNYILRTFSFHFTVLKIVNDIQKVEAAAVNFNPSKYPSFFRRTFDFVIGEYWKNFWIELPNRVTLATPRDVRLVKDGIRYSLGLTVAVGFTLTTSHSETYYFGMAILARIAQQTASETLQIGIMRICGLAFGASFAHLISRTTTELWQSSLMMVAMGFLCVTVQQHALYGQVGQYAVITLIAGIPLAQQSTEKLMNRVTDNVFAFSFYLIICLVVFPVDPIRVVSNYRTKCIIAANNLAQRLVVLGCCPITQSAEEAKFIIADSEKIIEEQRTNLLEAQAWNAKAAVEPAVRGDEFPAKASEGLIVHLAEFSSLQESLLDSMKVLHRHRTTEPSLLIQEIMDLIRPFLLDAAKLLHRYFQQLIDSAEKPFEWSLEKTSLQVWRCQLSLLSIRQVTGNIQRSFIAALLPDRGVDSARVNKYISSAAMEAAVLDNNMNDLQLQGSFSIQTLMMSFRRAAVKAAISREDLCVFESVVVHFALLMRTVSNCLEKVIEIHSFEQSRRM